MRAPPPGSQVKCNFPGWEEYQTRSVLLFYLIMTYHHLSLRGFCFVWQRNYTDTQETATTRNAVHKKLYSRICRRFQWLLIGWVWKRNRARERTKNMYQTLVEGVKGQWLGEFRCGGAWYWNWSRKPVYAGFGMDSSDLEYCLLTE